MATSSGRPGMSPLWTKSWSLKLTLGGRQLGWDGTLPSLPRIGGLSLDLILLLLLTCVYLHLTGRWAAREDFHTLLTLKDLCTRPENHFWVSFALYSTILKDFILLHHAPVIPLQRAVNKHAQQTAPTTFIKGTLWKHTNQIQCLKKIIYTFNLFFTVE